MSPTTPVEMPMAIPGASDDRRTPCVLFLTCVGAGPKYFLQLSDDFRRRYRILPYMFNDIKLLPDLLPVVEEELAQRPLLIYHDPDCLPYLGQYRERYDQFVERIPPEVTRISIPQPGFSPFWPFHCGDPRNADNDRPRNRFGGMPVFPYGDTYVLRLLKEGLPPEEVIERYLAADVSSAVDLDRLLRSALTMLERQDRAGPVKVTDYVADNFRSRMLFQTVNHANNRLFLYVANQVLGLLDCAPVPEQVLDTITEVVERPMPVHPSLARYFGVGYIDENSRYPVDDVRNLTFAEYIRDYVYFANGLFNYGEGLVNDPTIAIPLAAGGSRGTLDDPPAAIIDQQEDSDLMALERTPADYPDSPEYIAYRLFLHIATLERQPLDWTGDQNANRPDRNWILNTYAQCLEAVSNPGSRGGGRTA